MGKMAIAVSRSNPEKVYALIESDSDKEARGLYVSTNAGKTWSQRHERAASGAASLVLHRTVHRSQEREHDLRLECSGPAFDRRRQDVGDVVGHARGLSRSLDQSRQSEQLRHLERRRGGDNFRQGQKLEHAKQHADGAVLSNQRRQSVPVPHLRRPAGQHFSLDRQPRVGGGRAFQRRVGRHRPAARAPSSRSIPTTRDSSSAEAIRARSR